MNSGLKKSLSLGRGTGQILLVFYGQKGSSSFTKVIHTKYYKHLKEGAHQSHFGRKKWAGFWQISLK
jgi:hypothetical protein